MIFSVNEEFTPARCSTSSNHRISFTGSPQLSQSHFMDRKVDLSTETSPTEKKKKLSQFLQESLGGDEDGVDPNTINSNQEAKPTNVVVFSKPTNGTPQLSKSNSIHSSERMTNRYFKSEKEKSGKTSVLPTKFSHKPELQQKEEAVKPRSQWRRIMILCSQRITSSAIILSILKEAPRAGSVSVS